MPSWRFFAALRMTMGMAQWSWTEYYADCFPSGCQRSFGCVSHATAISLKYNKIDVIQDDPQKEQHMDFTDVVLRRRMVRHFTPEPVAPDVIERVIELARHAPSAGFTQGQAFVVVTQPQLKQAIARICGEEGYVEGGFHSFISEAPVVVIACTSEAAYHRRYQEPDKLQEDGTEIVWPIPFWHMDAGCAVMKIGRASCRERV